MINKVQEVSRLHDEAMEFTDLSFRARLFKEREKYLHFTRLALEKEAAAADLMVDEDIEPTRSVLHRSAATLAWRCEEYDEAKRLICRALAGNPPPDIEYELNDLLEKVDHALLGCAETNGNYRATDETTSKVGFLKVADVDGKSECKLITEANETWTIQAPVETMNEIVRAYFNRRVEVEGKQMKKMRLVKRILLETPDQVRAV